MERTRTAANPPGSVVPSSTPSYMRTLPDRQPSRGLNASDGGWEGCRAVSQRIPQPFSVDDRVGFFRGQDASGSARPVALGLRAIQEIVPAILDPFRRYRGACASVPVSTCARTCDGYRSLHRWTCAPGNRCPRPDLIDDRDDERGRSSVLCRAYMCHADKLTSAAASRRVLILAAAPVASPKRGSLRGLVWRASLGIQPCRRPFVLEGCEVHAEAVPPDCARIPRGPAVALAQLVYGRLEGSVRVSGRSPRVPCHESQKKFGPPIPIRKRVLRQPLSSLNVAVSIPRALQASRSRANIDGSQPTAVPVRGRTLLVP
ncbi:hypothetical protein C8Q70DRAFT_587810 [Cubamyces menziesii]|nr:hypothetical protein C8Q70DRAFT_587810 [Cubamyces menziesii]